MEKEKQEPSDVITSTCTHLIFVYGTFGKGKEITTCSTDPNSLESQKPRKRYALYGSGIPFLSRAKAISQVTGEVYAVDDATLKRLDQLEGHPDWYKREQAEVVLQDGTELIAWIYFCDTPQRRSH